MLILKDVLSISNQQLLIRIFNTELLKKKVKR
jgi:hypothetical protein